MPVGPTVLIVDDDVTLARAFCLALGGAGYRPRAVHSAEDALRELATAAPDAIILDFRMPMINGLGFLYRLRSQPQYVRTPVMVVTGESALSDEERDELRMLGAELQFKPIGLDALLHATSMLLAGGIAPALTSSSPALPAPPAAFVR
jgi:CheY-like chemotaxis protein